MVGQLGLLRAGEALGRRDYQQYFLDSMQTMAEHFTYACYDAAQFGGPHVSGQGHSIEGFGLHRHHGDESIGAQPPHRKP